MAKMTHRVKVRVVTAVLLGWLAVPLHGAARLTFTRTLAAAHPVPGEVAALIYAIGDTDKVNSFVDALVQHVNRSEFLRIEDVPDRTRHFLRSEPGSDMLRMLRREHPADAYIGVKRFTCTSTEQSGLGSSRDSTGERVKRRHIWTDAVCTGRVDMIDGATGRKLSSFDVKGEGTSPRVPALTNEERDIALEQAARYAAIQVAETITPRRLRESIELEEKAPAFADGYALITASRLSEARAQWESALRNNPASPALHFNLGVVCEALGDVRAALEHYEEAHRLAPDDRRFRLELDSFRRRSDGPP